MTVNDSVALGYAPLISSVSSVGVVLGPPGPPCCSSGETLTVGVAQGAGPTSASPRSSSFSSTRIHCLRSPSFVRQSPQPVLGASPSDPLGAVPRALAAQRLLRPADVRRHDRRRLQHDLHSLSDSLRRRLRARRRRCHHDAPLPALHIFAAGAHRLQRQLLLTDESGRQAWVTMYSSALTRRHDAGLRLFRAELRGLVCRGTLASLAPFSLYHFDKQSSDVLWPRGFSPQVFLRRSARHNRLLWHRVYARRAGRQWPRHAVGDDHERGLHGRPPPGPRQAARVRQLFHGLQRADQHLLDLDLVLVLAYVHPDPLRSPALLTILDRGHLFRTRDYTIFER
jgi:hypothetical protein